MIIRSLKLQNFRKHKNAFMEFPEGLFGIVGNNGAGKTSIIEAIAWSIYGAHACKTGQELLRTEAVDSDADCRTELEFSLGADSYRVVRELRGRRQSGYAAVFVNGGDQPEVEGTHPVTRFLTNKIGMDYTSFFTSVFAKQKELDSLTDLQAGTRKKRILRLLRIDRIDAAIEQARKDRKQSELVVEAVKGTQQDLGQLESALDGSKKQKEKDREYMRAARDAVDAAKGALRKAKTARDRLERKHVRYMGLEGRLNVQGTQKELNEKNLGTQMKELSELESAKTELAEIAPELKSYKSVKAKKERLDSLREKHLAKNQLQGRSSELKGNIGQLKKERKGVLAAIAKSKNLDSQLAKAEESVEALRRVLSTSTRR